MTLMCKLVALFVPLWMITAEAATLQVVSDSVRVEGLIDKSDGQKLDDLLSSGLKNVIFGNSLGGTESGARKYIAIIQKYGVSTEVQGKCFSACALAFAAGKERKFSKKNIDHILWFHMARMAADESVEAPTNDDLLLMLDKLTDFKLREPARSKIRKSFTAASGVMFISRPGFFGRRIQTLYCDGSQGADASLCTPLDDADPLALGIVTSLD